MHCVVCNNNKSLLAMFGSIVRQFAALDPVLVSSVAELRDVDLSDVTYVIIGCYEGDTYVADEALETLEDRLGNNFATLPILLHSGSYNDDIEQTIKKHESLGHSIALQVGPIQIEDFVRLANPAGINIQSSND